MFSHEKYEERGENISPNKMKIKHVLNKNKNKYKLLDDRLEQTLDNAETNQKIKIEASQRKQRVLEFKYL